METGGVWDIYISVITMMSYWPFVRVSSDYLPHPQRNKQYNDTLVVSCSKTIFKNTDKVLNSEYICFVFFFNVTE